MLDRSLRWGEHETALEEGWLLAELEQRFGYGLDELARRFDHSTSWVSRRLALVELLPESVQRQVRSGAITAHVAMKFLVPVARASLEDCQLMGEKFAAHRFTSREAGQLYAAWRNASPAIRQRILDEPQLFLKAQRQCDPRPPSTAIAELSRDLSAPFSFRLWVTDLASPALLKMLQKAIGGPLVEAGSPLKFAPDEDPEFFARYAGRWSRRVRS